MKTTSLILLACVLCAGFLDIASAWRRHKKHHHHKDIYQCLDANANPPPEGSESPWDDSSEDRDDKDVWAMDADGKVTLYCWDGCCNKRGWTYCCGDDYWHHRHHDDDDDSSHRKRLLVVCALAGAIAVASVVILAIVCVLKKKARRRTRVYTSRYPVVLTADGMKKPLPDDEIKGVLPPGYKEPYIVKGVAPPDYSFTPSDTFGPHPSPDAPPSYSTLSIHQVVRESEEKGVVPVGTE